MKPHGVGPRERIPSSFTTAASRRAATSRPGSSQGFSRASSAPRSGRSATMPPPTRPPQAIASRSRSSALRYGMGPLAELPGWLQAAGWGAVCASGLLIGAVGGYYTALQHTSIARAMTFAAGVLLAVVAVDLVINARGAASLHWTVMGLLCGAAVFSSVNF